ncbi:armadillo-type protein [Dunaliella salina]|uniref:Armadillo-type protein n=1 Tax=Dunaliella salina TaxID=3046 RepID=A0ABQ7G145_DUNSA|nr:armadillo-type protein [Dunaliella salina]|eukprot:KAF5828330.1 armadillo-type protein [Dunaliella salina]
MEKGSPEERMAACGTLHALAQSPKHVQEVVNNRVVMATVALMGGDHDRSRQPAAQFLAFLAQRPEYSARVADNALLLLLEGCKLGSVPGWGGARMTMLHCVTAIRSLIENVQCEASEPKIVRRNQLIVHGAVSTLVQLLAYAPRLPEPSQVPAPPPNAVGKSGRSSGSRKSKGKQVSRLPAGRKDCISTQASACLRFLATCPEFMPELIASGSLGTLLSTLLTASDEQAAYVCGILWEATSDLAIAQQVLDQRGVPILLHIISTCLLFAKTKGKRGSKPKSAEDAGQPERRAQRPQPVSPPSFPDIAICNATGVLHHLTFLDRAKVEVGKLGGVRSLALCLKIAHIQTKENATGALYNMGMDPANVDLLAKEAGLPGFLAHPMPMNWLVKNEDDEEDAADKAEDEFLEGQLMGSPSSFFLTQDPRSAELS